jgi:hypothetical protein
MASTLAEILQGLLSSLGNKLAGFDLQEADYKNALQRKTVDSKKQRTKGLMGSRQNMSDRGTLDSSITLDEIGRLNSEFDTYDSDIQSQAASYLASLANQRTQANADYNTQKSQAEMDYAEATPSITPTVPTIPDPTPQATPAPAIPGLATSASDPLGWDSIAASTAGIDLATWMDLKAKAGPDWDPSDPYNWKGIAKAQAPSIAPSYQASARTALSSRPVITSSTPSKSAGSVVKKALAPKVIGTGNYRAV